MSDEEGLEQVRDLLAQEGLCLGLSSGINVAGAMKLARQLGPGKRIVTILADTGFRYLSTLYNRQWLEQNGLTEIGRGSIRERECTYVEIGVVAVSLKKKNVLNSDT